MFTTFFPSYRQLNAMDCGPTCLRIVARYYKKRFNANRVRQLTGFNKEGVSLLGILDAAEMMGFGARGVKLTYDQLKKAPLPCILHWDQNHFVVLMSFKSEGSKAIISDPQRGIISFHEQEFTEHWICAENENDSAGIALLLEPTLAFYEQEEEKTRRVNFKFVLGYLKNSKWPISQVFICLLLTCFLQLIFPFLTKAIVDSGIRTKNLHFVLIILVAQLMLVFSRTVVDFLRSRLLLRISNILDLSILSDFWIKITRIPVSYFDVHHTGDTLQRVSDHKQIQTFLTGTALGTLLSVVSFFVYAVVLVLYNYQLFFIFISGSIIYFSWIQLFLRIRRKINYQSFYLSAKENNATLQFIQGIHEIKLNNAEMLKRRNWEDIQVMLFRLNFKNLNYGQWQQTGALFINQSKDIIISFIVAKLVIDGKLTLGAMLSIQYILGQLSSPVEQWAGFMQSMQDAKIGMERLNEVHELEDEEIRGKKYIDCLPLDESIHIERLVFAYPGTNNRPVLDDISVDIPAGKVTAIVGVSGSGKTSLLKILLKFHDDYEGVIEIGGRNFKDIRPSFWRSQCGAVLQDGYIFNDSIARNIAVGEETPDITKLETCCRIVNILSFVKFLPNGFDTQLGVEGTGISQGQKQRLLIARAIYKDPRYLFFDEATNALDASNERFIVENLKDVFRGRTVVVVAHRLSTVRDADKIILIREGKIAEEGNHETLCAFKGYYYELVKNQLEIGI